MKIELTPKQAEVIVEALGLALNAVPPVDRVGVATMQYAPIVQLIQQASKSPIGSTGGDNRPEQHGHRDEHGQFVPDQPLV